MASNTIKTYRNLVTGVVDEYPESVARAVSYLEEVEPGTKTLINPPASPEALVGHIAWQESKSDDEPETESDNSDEETK